MAPDGVHRLLKGLLKCHRKAWRTQIWLVCQTSRGLTLLPCSSVRARPPEPRPPFRETTPTWLSALWARRTSPSTNKIAVHHSLSVSVCYWMLHTWFLSCSASHCFAMQCTSFRCFKQTIDTLIVKSRGCLGVLDVQKSAAASWFFQPSQGLAHPNLACVSDI